MIKKIVVFLITWKTVVMLFAYIAIFIIPLRLPYSACYYFRKYIPYSMCIWGNFDGLHYMQIAEKGYNPFELPFFPFYPLTIRLFASLFHLHLLIAAQLISHVSLIITLILIRKLLRLDKNTRLYYLLCTVILLFPTSLFYGAAYNDSLFFLLATFTVYFSRKQAWGRAGIMGAFATLTRLNGLALIFLILFEYVLSKDQTVKSSWNYQEFLIKIKKTFTVQNILKSKIYSATLIPLSFIGYLSYIHRIFGDWTLVFSAMKAWGQHRLIFPLQVFWRYFKIIVLHPTFKLNYWVAVLEILFILFYIAIIIYAYKKIRPSYWVFFVISILIPSLTGTFQGMPRYGLHLYPFFLSIGYFLKNKPILFTWIYFSVSILLLFFYVVLFTRGYFVA